MAGSPPCDASSSPQSLLRLHSRERSIWPDVVSVSGRSAGCGARCKSIPLMLVLAQLGPRSVRGNRLRCETGGAVKLRWLITTVGFRCIRARARGADRARGQTSVSDVDPCVGEAAYLPSWGFPVATRHDLRRLFSSKPPTPFKGPLAGLQLVPFGSLQAASSARVLLEVHRWVARRRLEVRSEGRPDFRPECQSPDQ